MSKTRLKTFWILFWPFDGPDARCLMGFCPFIRQTPSYLRRLRSEKRQTGCSGVKMKHICPRGTTQIHQAQRFYLQNLHSLHSKYSLQSNHATDSFASNHAIGAPRTSHSVYRTRSQEVRLSNTRIRNLEILDCLETPARGICPCSSRQPALSSGPRDRTGSSRDYTRGVRASGL